MDFRFHLTMDTLAFGCKFPTIRALYGLSPIRLRPCRAKSSRRGWLTPVLSQHRAYRSVHGVSVVQRCAYALHLIFLTLSVLALFSVSNLPCGKQPLSSNCYHWVSDNQRLSYPNRQALSSIYFHRLLRYYGLS